MTGYIQSLRKIVGHTRLIAVGSGVFIYKDGKVLLQKRRDNQCWADHGGCVEIGESVEDAARRELFEETGLIAGKLELLGVFSGEDMMYTYPNGDEIYIIGISWLCEDFSGELRPQEEETAELRWFDLDDLPEAISPPVRRSLQKFIETVQSRKQAAQALKA